MHIDYRFRGEASSAVARVEEIPPVDYIYEIRRIGPEVCPFSSRLQKNCELQKVQNAIYCLVRSLFCNRMARLVSWGGVGSVLGIHE